MESTASTTGIVTERFDQLLCSQCDCPMDISKIEPFSRIECPSCGHAATVPAKLGHFILLDLIGTGGMGGVYIAEDASLDRMVAIKVMLESLGRNAESIATFTREAQAAARLNHPNIAQIYSIGQEGGQPYIVMELVAGRGLDRIIDAGQTPGQRQIMQIALQVALALEAAENAGLVHGDIKPENILLDDRGAAKLVDFGLASLAGQGNAEGIWGTPYYIAPEKVRGQKGDHRADIYSLGATLYHVLTGTPPFDGKTPGEVVRARLNHPPVPLKKARTDITPEVAHVVARMLKEEPSLRHPTYASLIGDLRKAIDTLPRNEKSLRRPKNLTDPVRTLTKRSPRVTQRVDTTPESAGTPTGRRPKIVLKTKRSQLTTRARASAGPTLVTLPPQKQQTKGAKVDPAVRLRRSKRNRVITLVLLSAAAIGGAAFLLKYRQDVKMDARREAYALSQLRDVAKAKNAEVSALTTNLSTLAQQARDVANQATNAIVHIREIPLNDSLLALLKPRGDEIDEPEPEERATEAETPASDGVAESNTVAATDAPATDTPPDAAPADEDEPAEAPQEDGKPEPAPVAETDAAVALTDEEKGHFAAARLAIATSLRIDEMLAAAQALELKAGIRMEEALKAPTSTEAATSVQVIVAAIETIKADRERATTLIKAASAGIDPLLQQLKEIERERENARRAAEEAERQQAAAAITQRKEAERQARVGAELSQAEQALIAARILLPQYRFKDAIASLDRGMNACRTDEGKAAFKLYLDRYKYLQDLKLFVIDCLNEYPQPWIWKNVKDVTKADEETLTLKGGQKVSWADVPTGQMLRFVNAYSSNQKIRLRSQCTALLGAAIYCREHGGQTAVAAATAYANRAVSVCSDLRDESERLLRYKEPETTE